MLLRSRDRVSSRFLLCVRDDAELRCAPLLVPAHFCARSRGCTIGGNPQTWMRLYASGDVIGPALQRVAAKSGSATPANPTPRGPAAIWGPKPDTSANVS